MSLPDNVRRLRITDGHSIEEVAEASGLSVALVAAIENGRTRVSPKVVEALARHFRIGAAELTR